MKEIIGDNLKQVFEHYGIIAKQTLCKSFNFGYEQKVEVWEIEDDECERFFSAIDDLSDSEYSMLFDDSWWQYSPGSIMGDPDSEYKIKGHEILAWDGPRREYDLDAEYTDYRNDEIECGIEENDIDSREAWEVWYAPREYSSVYEYMCEELGASMERNTTALMVDLAKHNNMKLSQLLELYA